MKDIKPHAPISELTPDGLAKSWFGMAMAGVAGCITLILVVLFTLR